MGDAVLQTRSDRDPPPKWVADVLAALRVRFPGADLGASVVKSLFGHFRRQWQRGQTSREAAQTVASCDGKTLSVATEPEDVPKVRAPKGSQPGQIFGADALRDPAHIARLVQRVARLEGTLKAMEAKRAARGAYRKQGREPQARETALRAELTQAREALDRARKAPPGPSRMNRKPRSAAGCPPTQAACKIGLLGGVCGLPAPLVLAAAQGSPIVRDARYCLTSAFRLKPSHVPYRGFVVNPSYPPGVQERPYDTDKGEQLKVIGIAQNLIPELIFNGAPGAIDGLPVVTADGVVLGGNGRTMGLQLHYEQGGTVAREYLLDHARQFGFTRAQVEAVADPAVVRVIETTPPDDPAHLRELQELVRLLNVPLLQGLSARSESVAEAKRLSDEVLEVLSVGLDDETTLAEYLSSRESRTLIGALRRAGILTNRNATRLLVPTGDSFSEDGKRFVERLLLASLVPDAKILDRLDGRIREALARSAPWWLSAAAGGADWDLRPALLAAARDLISMDAEGATSVDAYLRQGRFDEPAAVTGVPLGETTLRFLATHGTRPRAVLQAARAYAAASRAHPSAQGSLLADEKVTPRQALDRAVKNLS